MVIDIIDPNDELFQNMSNLQYAMIQSAQAQKNAIMANAAEKKLKLRNKMLANGVRRSTALTFAIERIDEDAETKVAVVREELLHQLAYDSYFSDGNENGLYRYPENPNYNLSYAQRFLVVRDYYMHYSADPQTRFNAFKQDTLARGYLGEFYQTLYDQLYSYI